MLLLYLNKTSHLYLYKILLILSETAFLTCKELGLMRVRGEILQLAEVSPPYPECIVCLIRLFFLQYCKCFLIADQN